VVVRLPRATVAPLIGAPPVKAVTVPWIVPLVTVVQEGYLKEPMRVRKLSPLTA
jgi:hypothetical protein